MTDRRETDVDRRRWPCRPWVVAVAGLLLVAAIAFSAPRMEVARAEGQTAPEPAVVHRPLHHMIEAYAEGKVVAIEYLTTFFCATTPSSDVDPPFGRGNGRPEADDPAEYQVPPCFFGDTGTGSILPPDLHWGAFPAVRTFFGLAPWFAGTPGGNGGPPAAAASGNGPASDIDTQCTEPGPPITEHRGQFGTCLMHPSMLRFAKMFDDATRQPPDPIPLPNHSHLFPVTSAAPGWWTIRGVAIYDRSIWPDRDGHCPAGPPHCVTSIEAMRAAQKSGQASVDVPSNVYWYMAVHPEG